MATGGGTENPRGIPEAQEVTVEDIRVTIKVATTNGMTEAAIAVTTIRVSAQTSHRTGETGRTNRQIGATSPVRRVDFAVEETGNKAEATRMTGQSAQLHQTHAQVPPAQCCHQ